jgi:hypothetical protein
MANPCEHELRSVQTACAVAAHACAAVGATDASAPPGMLADVPEQPARLPIVAAPAMPTMMTTDPLHLEVRMPDTLNNRLAKKGHARAHRPSSGPLER